MHWATVQFHHYFVKKNASQMTGGAPEKYQQFLLLIGNRLDIQMCRQVFMPEGLKSLIVNAHI